MYSVFIEMPSGATSKPHEFLEVIDATKLFNQFVLQMRPWKNFIVDIILTENGKVLQREKIFNA